MYYTDDTKLLIIFIGQISCEVLNQSLKFMIKQDRPKRRFLSHNKTEGEQYLRVAASHGPGHGMPSSHAEIAAFLAVISSMFLITGSLAVVPTDIRRPLVAVSLCSAAVIA
jgi:dolichyldiphosphatase